MTAAVSGSGTNPDFLSTPRCGPLRPANMSKLGLAAMQFASKAWGLVPEGGARALLQPQAATVTADQARGPGQQGGQTSRSMAAVGR